MDKIEFPYIDHRISQESMEDAKDILWIFDVEIIMYR